MHTGLAHPTDAPSVANVTCTEITGRETVQVDRATLALEFAVRHNDEAKQRYKAGDIEEAERLFKQAIRSDAGFVEPYSNLAVLY